MLGDTDKEFNKLIDLVRSFQRLKSEFLLTPVHSFIDKKDLWLVMPRMSGGRLSETLNSHYRTGIPDETIVSRILLDIINGLAFMHENKVAHRNVRATSLHYCKDNGKTLLTEFAFLKETESYVKKHRRNKLLACVFIFIVFFLFFFFFFFFKLLFCIVLLLFLLQCCTRFASCYFVILFFFCVFVMNELVFNHVLHKTMTLKTLLCHNNDTQIHKYTNKREYKHKYRGSNKPNRQTILQWGRGDPYVAPECYAEFRKLLNKKGDKSDKNNGNNGDDSKNQDSNKKVNLFAVDIYAIGVTALTLAFGEPPKIPKDVTCASFECYDRKSPFSKKFNELVNKCCNEVKLLLCHVFILFCFILFCFFFFY